MPTKQKILIVGKKGILSWIQDLSDAMTALEMDHQNFWTNPTPAERLDKHLHKQRVFDSPRITERFKKTVLEYKPTAVLMMNLQMCIPRHIHNVLQTISPQPILLGWMCDCQPAFPKQAFGLMDRLYYFDSHMIQTLEQQYTSEQISYLPLAVNPERYFPANTGEKTDRLLFIGSRTPSREKMLNRLQELNTPLAIYGPKKIGLIRTKRLSTETIRLSYNRHAAVLNINQPPNTYNGLNLRAFEAPASRARLITPNCADLPLCYEPGQEILSYSTAEEAADLFDRIITDVDWAEKIAKNGFKRALAQHTFRHRAQKIKTDLENMR